MRRWRCRQPARGAGSAPSPGTRRRLPERVLVALLSAWDDPGRGAPLRVMVTAAVQDRELGQLLKEVLEHEMIDRVADHIGGPQRAATALARSPPSSRAWSSAATCCALDPVATMTADEISRYLAPGLRAALYGTRPSPAAAKRPPAT